MVSALKDDTFCISGSENTYRLIPGKLSIPPFNSANKNWIIQLFQGLLRKHCYRYNWRPSGNKTNVFIIPLRKRINANVRITTTKASIK